MQPILFATLSDLSLPDSLCRSLTAHCKTTSNDWTREYLSARSDSALLRRIFSLLMRAYTACAEREPSKLRAGLGLEDSLTCLRSLQKIRKYSPFY